jgi:single-stranded-DNA-specific exonuclease
MAIDPTKRWLLKPVDEELVARHVEVLQISPLLARILILRGLENPADARRYLSSSLRADLPSPFEMADMGTGVERIVAALKKKDRIAIWADYDVDGTTGAAVLVSFLREIGADPVYHVPHRIDEGYGLNMEGLRRLRERGAGLVVTVDCGISNAAEIDEARRLNLDVVVVDHHLPPAELPRAVAVINPQRRDCQFPDKGLCAAGLAFYLVIGLRAKLREAGWFVDSTVPDIRRYLDIVALGTIADMVPLRGVNRTLIRRGLMELGSSTRPGLVALKQVANLPSGEVSAGQVGFQLGPRINAAGRVDCGLKVVELLTTDSSEIALRIAEELETHNRERRAIEGEVLEQALRQAEERVSSGDCYSLVLGREGWHPGVLGIVASRVVERFYRPTVVIGFHDGMGKGSARSIRGFHMVDGLQRCADHLEKFGGHEYAGGLSLREEQFAAFSAVFESVTRESLAPQDLIPLLEIDAALEFSQIGFSLMRAIQSLKPFGVGNPEPLFLSHGVEVAERRLFSGGARHRLRQGNQIMTGVSFGVGENFGLAPGSKVDLAYRLGENEWNGTKSVELKIVDWRPRQGSQGG